MNRVTVQRIVVPFTAETAELYWRHVSDTHSSRVSPEIGPGALLDLDTYFNSFDELLWRGHTRLGGLRCTLELDGVGRVELWRYTLYAPPALLAEAFFEAGRAEVSLDVPALPHPRAAGRLALRIVADGEATVPTRLLGGAWTTDAGVAPTRMMPVICTFDRDIPLFRVLARLSADAVTLDTIAGVVIVNNGPGGLPARIAAEQLPAALSEKLHVVEQANFGGSGGFTRGLMEAEARGATHAVLIDDDVIIEPEAVFRTARLFGLAKGDLVVGGQMLDLFRPTHVYEAGARVDGGKLATVPLHLGAEVSKAGHLDRFLEPAAMHYNGWWFQGFSLSILERFGYPMPCFIRGDDVEFGHRLHDAGIPLVSTPGIAIWHEPFYAKLGSWHVYYEFRNMFVFAARHLGDPGRLLAFIALKWIIAEMLMFRYARAALLIRATEDFLKGPGIFQRDPRTVHAEIIALRQAYPIDSIPRERVVQRRPPETGPRHRLAFLWQLAFALVEEWFRPDDDRSVICIDVRDHIWFRVRKTGRVAVREAWEAEYPLYTRSRATFRTLFVTTIRLSLRLLSIKSAVVAWRDAHRVFTSRTAWQRYLGVEDSAVERRDAGMAGINNLVAGAMEDAD